MSEWVSEWLNACMNAWMREWDPLHKPKWMLKSIGSQVSNVLHTHMFAKVSILTTAWEDGPWFQHLVIHHLHPSFTHLLKYPPYIYIYHISYIYIVYIYMSYIYVIYIYMSYIYIYNYLYVKYICIYVKYIYICLIYVLYIYISYLHLPHCIPTVSLQDPPAISQHGPRPDDAHSHGKWPIEIDVSWWFTY